MNRRDLLKLLMLGMAPIIPCWKRREPDVTRLGDEITRLLIRASDPDDLITPDELRNLRLKLNTIEDNAALASSMFSGDGALDPNLFLNKQRHPFNKLPHETAMLYMGSNEQTISNGTATVLTAWDDPYTLSPDDTDSFDNGLKVDASTGRIYVTGIPNRTVIEIYASIYFKKVNDSTHRTLRWKADDGSFRHITRRNNVVDGSTDPLFLELNQRRELPSGETWYELEVEQWSGGDLDVYGGLFYVSRQH